MRLFRPDEYIEDGDNQWAASCQRCDPSDPEDELILHVADAVRNAYGQEELLRLVEPDPSVSENFNVEAILNAFKAGLPDPDAEGNKPEQLKNYRSESCEIIAREALNAIFHIEFTPTLHAMKGNPNQPILGFDGWGLVRFGDNTFALALFQVKGTEDTGRPPDITTALVEECQNVPTSKAILIRHICACAIRVKGTGYERILLDMIAQLGEDQLPPLVVSPVVVRGALDAKINDLDIIRDNCNEFLPARTYALSVSVGAPLQEFGRIVFERARAT